MEIDLERKRKMEEFFRENRGFFLKLADKIAERRLKRRATSRSAS